MIIITTRSYPPELGGMQSLMGGLAIHLNNLHQIKVLANSFAEDESYDKINNFETIVQKYLTKKISLHDKNKDGHYNLISALHKSIRGSDEQASLYWFYRMIEVNEDVNYIMCNELSLECI
jgi:replication-associated recombination protein RarA